MDLWEYLPFAAFANLSFDFKDGLDLVRFPDPTLGSRETRLGKIGATQAGWIYGVDL